MRQSLLRVRDFAAFPALFSLALAYHAGWTGQGVALVLAAVLLVLALDKQAAASTRNIDHGFVASALVVGALWGLGTTHFPEVATLGLTSILCLALGYLSIRGSLAEGFSPPFLAGIGLVVAALSAAHYVAWYLAIVDSVDFVPGGVMGDRNALGAILVTLSCLLTHGVLRNRASMPTAYQAGFWAVIAVGLVTALLQQSRGVAVSLIIAVIVSLLLSRRGAPRTANRAWSAQRALVLCALIALPLLSLGFAAFSRFSSLENAAIIGVSTNARLGQLDAIFSAVTPSALLVGHGLGSFRAMYQSIRTPLDIESAGAYAHNDYAQLFFEGGMLALLLWIAFYLVRLRGLVTSIHASSDTTGSGFFLLLAYVYFAVHACFTSLLFIPASALVIGVALRSASGPNLSGQFPRWGCRLLQSILVLGVLPAAVISALSATAYEIQTDIRMSRYALARAFISPQLLEPIAALPGATLGALARAESIANEATVEGLPQNVKLNLLGESRSLVASIKQRYPYHHIAALAEISVLVRIVEASGEPSAKAAVAQALQSLPTSLRVHKVLVPVLLPYLKAHEPLLAADYADEVTASRRLMNDAGRRALGR